MTRVQLKIQLGHYKAKLMQGTYGAHPRSLVSSVKMLVCCKYYV